MVSRENGFSLVELVVVLFIFSVVSIAATSAFDMGQAETNETRIQLALQETLREGVQRMALELRESAFNQVNIDTRSVPNSVTFQIPAAISNSGQITWSSPVRYQVGGATGRQLLRRDLSTGQTTVLANDVVDLILRRLVPAQDGTDGVNITLQARRTSAKGRVLDITRGHRVSFRNA
jgi:prepilin-type N-terminal cleavage/methylation domain-containing protein